MTPADYEVIQPRLFERLAWLAVCLGLVSVPFFGLALNAPWHWYVYASLYLLANAVFIKRKS